MHRIFRRNLGTKLISFLFAILFWLFVMNQGTTEKFLADQTLTIPLVVNGLPQNMVLMTQLPSVRVRLQGINPSASIKDIYAEVDLSNGVVGERSYAIKVNTPSGTHVVDLQPSSVKLRLDSVEEKSVPVVATVTGTPADGYQAEAAVVKPSAVNVRGPSSVLSTLEKVTTEISVTGAKDTMEGSRPLSFRNKEGKLIYSPNPSIDILSAYPSTVDVIVPIVSKEFSTKMIPLKVTSTGTPADSKVLRSLVSSPASVQVMGIPQALKGLDSLTLGPVDISNLTDNKIFQISTDKVTLPSGVAFVNNTTLNVIAQIGSEAIQKKISGVSVQIKNIGTGLGIGQSVAAVAVEVKGFSDVLQNLTADQIQLWVDASGQVAGSYSNIKVYWQLPSGVTMVTAPEVSYSLKAQETKGE